MSERGKSDMYGEELFRTGLLLIAAAALLAAAGICVYLISSSKLKKQLESEYGKNNRHIR